LTEPEYQQTGLESQKSELEFSEKVLRFCPMPLDLSPGLADRRLHFLAELLQAKAALGERVVTSPPALLLEERG
jgi:hypothetical protein